MNVRIAVVGLGYVGLPLAVAFARSKLAPVIGFDSNGKRIEELKAGYDRTNEITPEELAAAQLVLANTPDCLREANFIIVAVPTPITPAKTPDLSALEAASTFVGQHLQPGTTVVFESTVYPGVSEGICAPIIERVSGLRRGRDWQLGYSPERINPGDREHTIERVVKVVAGEDAETLDRLAAVYEVICLSGVHRAPSIQTAEAAKVIENAQRDLNIALMNELALIFARIGLSTKDVLAAAQTKWNFHQYSPGLVGGHCIGVDPYYLSYLAETSGYHPQVILAGRRINDAIAKVIVEQVIRQLVKNGGLSDHRRVNVLGLTFKENVPDVRNSKVQDVIRELKAYDLKVTAYDPILQTAVPNFGQDQTAERWQDLTQADATLLLVAHQAFTRRPDEDFIALVRPGGVLFDLKGCLLPGLVAAAQRTYLSL